MQTGGRDRLYDFIAIVMVGFSLLVFIVVVLLLLNPTAPFNPFPPGQAGVGRPLPTVFQIPTLGATLAPPTLPPTWTPSPSSTGGPTITASPTLTVTATATGTTTKVPTPTHSLTPSPTGATATRTPTESPFPYVLQPGTPRDTTYFADPNVGCDWAGVAGQVIDKNNLGVIGATVHVFGSGVNEKRTSGSDTDYGSGGWEVNIHIMPVARDLSIQIENSLGEALSEEVEVTTGDTCSSNLTIVNFVKVE